MQHFQAIGHTLRPLLNEIADEIQVMDSDLHERDKIVWPDGERQIGDAPFLVEKLRRPRGKGAEEQFLFSIKHPRVEMRHSHRRCRIERLPIDLRLMFLDDLGIVADQPLATDREAAESLGFRNSRHLQQRQTASARTDENEFCSVRADFVRRQMLGTHFPSRICFSQTDHAMPGGDAATFLLTKPVQELARDRAEIHIGAAIHLRRSDGYFAASIEQQWSPARDGGAVGRIFHPLKEMMVRHRGMSGSQKIDLFFAMHKTQVRDGVNKLLRVVHHAGGHGVAPKLLRVLKLLEDLDRFSDVYRSVGLPFRRVAQLANAGVPGPRVVPTVRAFLRQPVSDFIELDGKSRLQTLQHCREMSGHHSAANQDHIWVLDASRRSQRLRIERHRRNLKFCVAEVVRRRIQANPNTEVSRLRQKANNGRSNKRENT